MEIRSTHGEIETAVVVMLGKGECRWSLLLSHSFSVLYARSMFDKFTEKAIAVIMLAQEESRRLGHNRVDTEHILLGLLRVPGRGSQFLAIDLEGTEAPFAAAIQ